MGTIFGVPAINAQKQDALVPRGSEFLAPGGVLVSGKPAPAPLQPPAWLADREYLKLHDGEGALSRQELAS
jgi:hypothetical protein